MKNIKYLIENNVFPPEVTQEIIDALKKENIDHLLINDESSENSIEGLVEMADSIENNFIVPYGSVGFIEGIKTACEGVWYDQDKLSWGALSANWSKHLLNREHFITTIGDLASRHQYFYDILGDDKHFAGAGTRTMFIKPFHNNKCFNAMILSEITADSTLSRFINDDRFFDRVDKETLVIVARPKTIDNEWRLFIAGKEIIGTTQYNKNKEKHYEEGCPEEVKDFVKDVLPWKCMFGGITGNQDWMKQNWQPDWAFSLDICESNEKLYVMETGCINCSDMYDMNKQEVFRKLTDALNKKMEM